MTVYSIARPLVEPSSSLCLLLCDNGGDEAPARLFAEFPPSAKSGDGAF